MTSLSIAMWGLLTAGLLASRASRRFTDRLPLWLLSGAGGALLGAVLFLMWFNPSQDSRALMGGGFALFGSIAFGAAGRRDIDVLRWGGWATATAGILFLTQASDLIPLCLGWELVRLGSRDASATSAEINLPHRWLSGMAWVAIAALLLTAGTTDLDALTRVWERTHFPNGAELPLGRPSLLLIAGLTAFVLAMGAAGIVGVSDKETGHPPRLASWGRWLRQTASAMVLARLFSGGCPGLTTTVIGVVVTIIVAQWLLAVVSLGEAQTWGELVDAMVRFQGGGLWLSTLLLLSRTLDDVAGPAAILSNAPASFVWNVSLLHGSLAVTALFAATSRSRSAGAESDFIDSSRGLGSVAPLTAWSLTLVLASLLGCPLLCGFWTTLLTAAAALETHLVRGDDLAVPVPSLLMVLLAGVATTLFLARGVIRIGRTLWWDPALGVPRPMSDGWPRGVAALAATALLALGVVPAWISMIHAALLAR